MYKRLIKTASISLLKNKGFTLINILGLALGLATCLLIIMYVLDELSYDKYNVKHDRIYRVNSDLKYGGTITQFAIAAPPVAASLKKEFPEVEDVTRLSAALNIRLKKGNEIIDEKNVFYCDSSVLNIFTLPLAQGNTKKALTDQNAIVISESTAKKYFNTTNVLGKTLTIVNDTIPRIITGVMADMPVQSHFKAEILMPLPQNDDNNWARFTYNTYILLKPGTDGKRLELKFNALMVKKINSPAFDYVKFSAKGNYIKLGILPLTDIHLRSNRQRELGVNGDIQYVYIFMVIALFILLLACVNFINLSTARSSNRAREVGVRKVLGSNRAHLIAQFLAESVLVAFFAGIIAIVAAWGFLPMFNQIAGKQMVTTMHTLTWLLPSLLGIVLIVGVFAGAYPAFFLSGFKPIHVLKGRLSVGFKGSALRNALVVFQFSMSIFLIIGTLVIYHQLNYIQNKDLGFNRNQVLIVRNITSLPDPKVFKHAVKALPGVIDATLTSYLPTGSNRWPNTIAGKDRSVQTELWPVDENYLNTMSMTLKAGRNFSENVSADSSAMIVNETAANMLGYTGNVLDKFKTGNTEYHIIGVVKDFNFSSLRDNVSPLAMVKSRDWMASLSIKVDAHNLPALKEKIESTWKTLSPNQHFDYSFMDEDFNAMYNNEQRMGRVFIVFTSLALIIACLGLFGLATYAAEQRNREIGIRKVLGASVANIAAMLSMDFIKLVVISFIIASPLAWLVMQKWLQGFAYRQNVQLWMLALAGFGAVAIALITIAAQSLKAAVANPVDSLRSE